MDEMLSGDGTEADFLNSYGGSYVDNQTPYDAADNGLVTQSNGTTSVSSPSWTSSLTSLFGLATQGAGVAGQLTGKTTAPAAIVASPASGTAASATTSKMMLFIGLAVAAIVGAFLFFKKH